MMPPTYSAAEKPTDGLLGCIVLLVRLSTSLLAVVLSLELSDRRIDDIVIVVHDLVDDATRSELDDAVSYRLDELMVMAGEEDVALEGLERIIERLDRLQVKVVRGAVEDEYIGILEHHARDHAAHLLTPREDRGTLEDLFAREEHTPKEALEVNFVGVSCEL